MGDYKDYGWIMLHRNLLESELWLKEPFTKGQAWVDLIGLANYAETKRIHKGQPQIIKRGELAVSEVWLAKRWKWSRGRVRRYIEMLVLFEMVNVKRTPHGTTLTVVNYDKYQSKRPARGTSGDTTGRTTGGTTGGTQKKEIKELKETKEFYGAYGTVQMTGGEYESLVSDFGEARAKEMIEALDEYKAATGKTYKNDAAAVRSFARNRKTTESKKESSFSKNY